MRLDERGKQCPFPVIETKKALEAGPAGTEAEVVVDNQIAVQNLQKMADHKGWESSWEKTGDREFTVRIVSGGGAAPAPAGEPETDDVSCAAERNVVVALTSDQMGQGDEELGKLLMKGFVYALTQQDAPPRTVLLYNGGARLSCEGSISLEDLKELEKMGAEILTCGTCLNHYGLTEKLRVGGVTNMYEIAQRLTGASLVVRP